MCLAECGEKPGAGAGPSDPSIIGGILMSLVSIDGRLLY